MTDYNPFAKTFSDSRKNMKWPELNYFFSLLNGKEKICDIGCWNGRFLQEFYDYFSFYPSSYLGIDLSEELLYEAKKTFPHMKFLQKNMKDISELREKFDAIFLIASFHHLETFEERQKFLLDISHNLHENGKIYMTNWDLQSSINLEKYKDSKIPNSENEFWWADFRVKIGKFERFYHSFSLEELEKLSENTGFTCIENRLFSGNRNTLSILKKSL